MQSQYVTIPDANFQNWLSNSSVAGCLNELGQLDTTCQALLDDTIVVCRYSGIADLEGIEYFRRLRYLDCLGNLLDSMPPLPDSLIVINCEYNNLSYLPSLPNKLRTLYCAENILTKLPVLPQSLLSLNCEDNPLDSLPPLPINIDSLDCSGNLLTALPSLPSKLQVLYCIENQLSTVPFGTSLKYLDCRYNLITSLPVYDSLQILICAYNQLTFLPLLPNTMSQLFCYENNIDSITNLPDSLKIIDCEHNFLTNLPSLPTKLNLLACQDNLLTELPVLPDSMQILACEGNPNLQCLPKLTNIAYLDFDSTAVTCIPNYGNVTTSIPPLDSFPLCTVNNPKGCVTYSSIPEIKALDFNLYPNPANNMVLLTLNAGQDHYNLQITDALGREIINTQIFNTTYQFSVNQLSDGLYFVRVSDGLGGVGVMKLVKQ